MLNVKSASENSNVLMMEGHVYHSRSETAENSFRYPIFNVVVLTQNFSTAAAQLKKRFFNVLKLKSEDYLNQQSGSDLDEEIKSFLNKNFNYQADTIHLQTIPKMFGYAFNPINFWYCYKLQKLDAVLCEVSNTFGEKHYYWLYDQGVDLNNKWLQAEKRFHVSPFFPIEGQYKFRFVQSEKHLHADVWYLNLDGSLKLKTWVSGELKNLSEISLPKLLFKYGWMTPFVVYRIHYQALKLYFKKVKFYSKPLPPQKEITDGSTFNRS